MKSIERKDLSTEQQNVNSSAIDNKSIASILSIINDEDQTIAKKVKSAIPEIE
ncbi:uncharacterized protein METZ01_LOCUS494385, partial [marine metagenome]